MLVIVINEVPASFVEIMLVSAHLYSFYINQLFILRLEIECALRALVDELCESCKIVVCISELIAFVDISIV